MPTLNLSPQLDSLSQLTATLDQFKAALDAGPSDPDIGAGVTDAAYVYLGAMRDRFRGASQHDGTWADLAPSTIYSRLRRNGARLTRQQRMSKAVSAAIPILYDTGRLYSSIVPGEPGFFEVTDRSGVTVGSMVPYAGYHQSGTSRMPARPIFVAPPSETLDRMKASVQGGIIQAWITASGNGS